MPRAASPRRPPPTHPVEVEDDDDELPAVQPQPDEIEELIASLAGDRQVSATVYRDIGDGFKAIDAMPIRSEMGLEDVLKHLAKKYGHGRYRLQLREVNQRGTLGNVNLPEIDEGAFGGPARVSDAAPTPVPPAPDPLRELLMKQNDQLWALMREQLVKPAAVAGPAVSMQEQMSMLATMFKFARGLSRAAGETELPAWMETLGKVVAPVIATVAENMQKPRTPPPPQCRPVANVATTAPVPVAQQQPQEPAAPAAHAAGTEADDAPSATERAIQGILNAAAAEPAPEPERYAAIIWNVARAEFTAIASAAPDGAIAVAVVDQIPALKDKAEFCRKLETALRAKCAPAPTPNGVVHGPQ